MEYASKGVGTAGLTTGIIGTAGWLLNGGLGGILGGGGNGCCSENMPVSRYELDMSQQLAAKDAKIGLLEADKYTDQKLSEVYKDLNSQVNQLAAEVRHNKDEQYAINLNQAVLNGTTGAAISCIQAQVATLQGLTKLVVPNTSVCPGWGDVTITPATAPTTGA
jgi:hypothetical protein